MQRTSATAAIVFSVAFLTIASLAPPVEAEGVEREIHVPAGWEGAYEFGYAPVIRVGDMVIVSGIPAGGDGTYEEKIRGMYERTVELLEAAGATIEDVVELTTFHSESNDSTAFGSEFDRYMPIHKEFFGDHRPAWTAVGTSALLSPTAPVEMRVIAVIDSGESSRVVFGNPPAPASGADGSGADDGSALTAAQVSGGLAGRWQGTLHRETESLRLVLNVEKTEDGLYIGKFTSVDQGNLMIPIDSIELDDDSVRLDVPAVNGRYDGTFNADQTVLSGTWTQGALLPLELRKASKSESSTASEEAAEVPDPSTEKRETSTSPLGRQLEIAVPHEPTPFTSGGHNHLVYELHLTNFDLNEAALRRIEVVAADETAPQPLATFEGTELIAMLRPLGAQPSPEVSDARALAPGRRVIAYLWITLDTETPVPQRLRHRIVTTDAEVEGGAIGTSDNELRVLGAPLEGKAWIAANGPGNRSGHRRALISVDGRAQIAQRFAIDWVQEGEDGHTFSGDPDDNASYHAYGDEVLAVADGTIATVKDGIPENVPGRDSRAVPITRETIAGNYVALDLGGGHFATYSHLQPGSLRVREGDRVRRGQVLGLLGNSGNSTEPHLHFQVANASSVLAAEGVPYVIDEYSVADPDGGVERRTQELPLQDVRVDF